MPESLFCREQWIAQSRFHSLSVTEIKRLIEERVKEVSRQGKPPLVIFDLDSTLYNTAPRTVMIVREWLQAHRGEICSEVLQAMQPVEEGHASYSLRDLFAALGLSLTTPEVQAAWEHLKEFWKPRFFSNEYLRYDRPYEGARDFVQRMVEVGALVVYLTGRDYPCMERGTRWNLRRDEFPCDAERTRLVMKAARNDDDYEHKMGAAKRLRDLGETVASFENEPKNLIGLQEVFPGALHVFVETVCSDHPCPAGTGLYRMSWLPASRR